MIELLSLPRRHSSLTTQLPGVKFKSGLPINSLPGWEHIPLNSKLPMLKCPGNQVIFSKNKIGQSVRDDRTLKHKFDPSGRDSFPEYNPLHDSNLKNFYANERNLKRLRENGEITQNNDVICNLKDFNEYRQQLHKSQLYYILQDLNRLEAEQHDRMLIANAEYITDNDHRNLTARQHTYGEILQRKAQIDARKADHYRKLMERTNEKIAYVQTLKMIRKISIAHKQALSQLKMQKHWDVRNDLHRKQLISLKKLFQFKKDRLQKNLRVLKERRLAKANNQQYASWNKRLAERIANQRKIENLLNEMDQQRRVYIENHKHIYEEKWRKIQEQIKNRAKRNRSKILTKASLKRRTKSIVKSNVSDIKDNPSICNALQSSFDHLLDKDICVALDAVAIMQESNQIPFDLDDPIYKAARFIMEHILSKFNKDLSDDMEAFSSTYTRLNQFFDEVKKCVLFRATQIISSQRNCSKSYSTVVNKSNSFANDCRVSFSKVYNTIGMSSYSVNPLIDIRNVNDRKPTPTGSLASIVMDSTTTLIERSNMPHLCRNDLVFIEHYFAKFRRALLVGVGKRVFAAIQCHFQGKIMNIRKELLELDRKFLLKQSTKAILSYAINPLNFESMLRLTMSALSSDIIWSLQQELLRPKRDPRVIAKPRLQCSCHRSNMKLCLFCHHNC